MMDKTIGEVGGVFALSCHDSVHIALKKIDSTNAKYQPESTVTKGLLWPLMKFTHPTDSLISTVPSFYSSNIPGTNTFSRLANTSCSDR